MVIHWDYSNKTFYSYGRVGKSRFVVYAPFRNECRALAISTINELKGFK